MPRRDLSLRLFEETFSFPAGRPIQVFFSNRFTLTAVKDLLKAAEIHILRIWPHASGEEAVFLCRGG